MMDLPSSWTTIRLADLGTWRGGGTPSKAIPAFWTNGTIPWVSPKDMKRPKLSTAQDLITAAAVKASATSLIDAGSVLMVTRSGILSHSLPVAVNLVPVTLNQDIKAITPSPATDGLFLWFAFKCFERDILNECRKGGTTVHSIEFPSLLDFVFPLPPLAEQKRIVSKIEELFSELDAGEESLRRARRQLGVYRQSLLKQAFEGKLTAPWRKQNPHLLESPDQLLNRIEEEREAHYAKQLKDWEIALKKWEKGDRNQKKPSKPRQPKRISDLGPDIRERLSELAIGWQWAKLGWMTTGPEYGSSAKSKKVGDCPVIRMGNIQRGEIDWEDLVFSDDADEIGQYLLESGDVLFNRTNSPELVGKTAIYRGTRPAIFAGYLVRVNQIRSIVSGDFLTYFLNSHTARQYGNTVKTDGVNQSNINADKLINYPFPYCSLPEQREIVRLLDEQFTVIEQNEREIDAALKRSAALRQSILKKAFTGQLVPQDPTDEPASALLERIRAERAATPSSRSHRIKTKK